MTDRVDRASKRVVKALEVLSIMQPLAEEHEVIWEGQAVDLQATTIEALKGLQTLATLARGASSDAIKRKCPICLARFYPAVSWQTYCSAACKAKAFRRHHRKGKGDGRLHPKSR